MKQARVIENITYDVTEGDPSILFTPEIAAQFSIVPDEVENLWRCVDGVWLPPEGAPTPEPPLPPLEYAKKQKITRIDAETRAAILAGFSHTIEGKTLHFAYDADSQQDFVDTASAATLATMGIPNIPAEVTWNGWEIARNEEGGETARALVRLTLDPAAFLGLYVGGALAHKATQMEIGGARKAAVEAATSIEEVNAA